MTILMIHIIAGVFYDLHQRSKKDDDIEPYNRKLLMLNMVLMPFGMSQSINLSLVMNKDHDICCSCNAAYITLFMSMVSTQTQVENLLDGMSVGDFTQHTGYLMIIATQTLSIHHAINISRFCYEKWYSNDTWCHRHMSSIIVVHSALYIIVFCVTRGNMAVMYCLTVIIDYPQVCDPRGCLSL